MGGLRASQGFMGTIGQPSAQFIEGSLRFNGVNQHLTKTFSSGNRRTFTLSYWIKEHGKGSSPTNNPHILWSGVDVNTRGGMVHRGTAGTDSGRIYMFNQVSASTNSAVWTEGKFRDFSGWKHVVFRVDSTISSPSTDRVRIYINGVEQDTEYKTTPTQNLDFQININQEHRIGRGTPDDYGNFSLSQYYFIDAQALGPDNFGFTDPLTNTWRPKKYEGTFGTTGFWLPFDGISPIGKDKSGNGNDWSPQNFSDSDILKDSPSGVVFGGPPTVGLGTTNSAPSNYATWNPLDNNGNTLSKGNLTCNGADKNVKTTIAVSSGKWYFENTGRNAPGIQKASVYATTNASNYYYYSGDGKVYAQDASGSTTETAGGSTFTSADTIGITLDLDNNELKWYKNGVVQDNITQSITSGEEWCFMVRSFFSEDNNTNFGQKPFKYAPPDGFVPLTSAGITPEIVITDPTKFVGVTIYDGNNGTRAFDLGMSPDFVWVKRRDDTFDNMLFDTVRGNGKEIYSERNYAQGSPATSKLNFIPNGFNLPSTGVNASSANYVAWFWKAGGKKNTFNVDDVGYSSASDAGLDGGTITPSGASVGTKQGFSIIQWRGVDNASPSTISHGLTNQTPRFIIVKNLTDAENWAVYHASVGATKYGRLNGNGSYSASSAYWNDTAPTTTLITLNNSAEVQRVNRDYVLYAWADVPGLQKFGSYTCNGDGSGGGDEDGPYVELGFRPALILFKGSSYTSDWFFIDDERCKVNYNDVALRANYQYGEIGNERGGVGSTSQPENYAVDLLSNGFKIRASGGSINSGTNTVTYAAWAKSPFSNLFGGQSNAK